HAAARERVYQNVNLVARNISLTSVMPFTLSAVTPGGGAMKLEGKAGPVNHEDAARTPIDAKINLAHADLGATRFLAPQSGLGGTLDLAVKVPAEGKRLRSEGKAKAKGVKLVRGGARARGPVALDYRRDYTLSSDTGTINADLHAGDSTATASGTVDSHGEE